MSLVSGEVKTLTGNDLQAYSREHSHSHGASQLYSARVSLTAHGSQSHSTSPSRSSTSAGASASTGAGRTLIDTIPWKRGNEVVPGVFVGSLECARALRFTSEHRIGAVLSLGGDWVPAQDGAYGAWHARVDVPEHGGDLLAALPRAVAFVQQARAAGRAVLVHSTHGQSRAPAVVAAYCELPRPGSLHTLTAMGSDADVRRGCDDGAGACARGARANMGRTGPARAARAFSALQLRARSWRRVLRYVESQDGVHTGQLSRGPRCVRCAVMGSYSSDPPY
jgi:hypothetical protein